MIFMSISNQFDLKNKFIHCFLESQSLFCSFDHIYLFGSVLNNTAYPNDIDLLLVYSIFTERLLIEKEKLCQLIEQELNIFADITMLNVEELHETSFLDKITNYYQVK